MMQPSLPNPSPKTASSIYDAIKDGDWEGLLALYATTAYDAVHSAEFARRGGGFHRQHSSPPSLMASMGGSSPNSSRRGVFRDEKKMEAAPRLTSPRQGYNNYKSTHDTSSSSSSSSSSSPSIRDLDLIVREIIGAEIFDEHHQGDTIINNNNNSEKTTSSTTNSSYYNNNNGNNTKQPPHQVQPNKKTRQHSPGRKSPPLPSGLSSALDHILFHHHSNNNHSSHSTSSDTSRRVLEKEMDWEKVMWESATVLSNSRPSPTFVVDRQDKDRRSSGSGSGNQRGGFKGGNNSNNAGGLKSMLEGVAISNNNNTNDSQAKVGNATNANGEKSSDTSDEDYSNPIFEGSVANATPGDLADGGTGSGTVQHLACLLDSPFALALLIVMGVNVEARHTAFRRLAVHEAACADSPLCLGLLMEVGGKFSMELFRDSLGGGGGAPASSSSVAAAAASAGGGGSKAPPAHSFASSSSFAAASATGFDSFNSIGDSFAGETDERNHSMMMMAGSKKPSKKKLGIFGWNKGKTPGGGSSSTLKKSSSDNGIGQCGKCTELTPFPVALKAMWEAAKFLRSGDMTEMDAAHYVLDRVKVSNRAMMVLALQCPHVPLSDMKQSGEEKAPPSLTPSPFASIPGLSAVNHLFQPPNHRDMQSTFIKRNVDGHGNTPLHWASFKNSIRSMHVLLSYNVDVNSRAQPSGWTPLHDAAYSDAADAAERLIAAGATVDARSHSGATPLCFAAQEDAPNATRMLLKAGADPSLRCLGNSPGIHVRGNNADATTNHFHSRFSGYTPLHYCAHYNAAKAARVLLYESIRHHHLSAVDLLEIPDLNEKLPIHVAVARGSNLVLRELLHGGARVETSSYHLPSPKARAVVVELAASAPPPLDEITAPVAIPRMNSNAANDNDEVMANTNTEGGLSTSPSNVNVITPVSSPILRAMIPSQPISSSKPWNCLSQTSIDACKHLIEEVEMNWTPERHTLFSPADRVAVVEVLRVGKRLETVGRGIFLDLWPHVLSFCGRGWFDKLEDEEEGHEEERKVSANSRMQEGYGDNEEEMQCSSASSSGGDSSGGDMEDSFTQFQLDGAGTGMAAIL